MHLVVNLIKKHCCAVEARCLDRNTLLVNARPLTAKETYWKSQCGMEPINWNDFKRFVNTLHIQTELILRQLFMNQWVWHRLSIVNRNCPPVKNENTIVDRYESVTTPVRKTVKHIRINVTCLAWCATRPIWSPHSRHIRWTYTWTVCKICRKDHWWFSSLLWTAKQSQ